MKVQIPSNLENERRYVVEVLMSDFLGIRYDLEVVNGLNAVKITGNQQSLEVTDVFFKQAVETWLSKASLPSFSLDNWNYRDCFPDLKLVEDSVPVIYGAKLPTSTYFQREGNSIRIGLDIFGSSFFMLSRYEELVAMDRDRHGRFPASASVAYKEGFLDRPVINEYLEILWEAMKQLWPGLERKQQSSALFLTHDVDRPFYYLYRSPWRAGVSFAGDLLKRRNYARARKRFAEWRAVRGGRYDKDPYYNFKYMMDTSEHYGVKSAFYFLADRSGEPVDADYDLDSKPIRNLLTEIDTRGHEIGLHGSYYSYNSALKLTEQKNKLQGLVRDLGIEQKVRGSRQHYLRWDSEVTPSLIEALEVDYDTTLSYADHAGFRCGVCYAFPIFDLVNKRMLNVYERPLIVMECSVMDESYMGIAGTEEALSYILKLYDRCRRFQGEFVMLWHNSQLCTADERDIYEQVLSH